MRILSVNHQTIKQFEKSNYKHRPVFIFHCEFENEYNGKTDNFYLFACVFYDNKPLLYGISKNQESKSVWDWRDKLCYAMKDAINNPFIEMTPFLLPNKTIHELAETVRNYIIQDLEPGSPQIIILNEPKDARRVLKRKDKDKDKDNCKDKDNNKDKDDCKEESNGFFEKIIKYFKE